MIAFPGYMQRFAALQTYGSQQLNLYRSTNMLPVSGAAYRDAYRLVHSTHLMIVAPLSDV